MRIVERISILLLLAVAILQASWLSRTRRMKLNEFQEKTSWVLDESVKVFLDREYMRPELIFSCSMPDEHTFRWKDKNATLSSSQEFHTMLRQALYDHLYENQKLNFLRLDSIYQTQLQQYGIFDIPVLLLENEAGEIILQDGTDKTNRNIITSPVTVGYECRHSIVAVFARPPFFRDMRRVLILEFLFLGAFFGCLSWQLRITRNKLKTAKVQAMGIAHLEHELRKPLAMLISQTNCIESKNESDFTNVCHLIHARLLKISDVTEMMLFALKKEVLKIKRIPLDIRQELEITVDMFRLLKECAKIDYYVEENIGQPVLDNVYFSCVISNLIDNGIKYNCTKNPEVRIYFGKESDNWILQVKDNGIGIPEKELKRVFNQFYRIENKRMLCKTGFGLGLTFVKKVIDAYEGKIEINSCPNKGTTVTIKIPILS